MNKVAAWLKWAFLPRTICYSEDNSSFVVDKIQLLEMVTPSKVHNGIDKVVRKTTKNKWAYVGIENHDHKCRICGREFWTEKATGDTCQRWACYKKFHVGA